MFRISIERTAKSKSKKKNITHRFILFSVPPTRRSILLISGVLFLTLYLFLKSAPGQKLLNTTFEKKDVSVEQSKTQTAPDYTFAQEPVKIDSKLIGPRKNDDNKNLPQRIIIPSLSIDLPVTLAPVIKGYWKVYPDRAGFGDGSAYPGDKGNTVIFAHARYGLFLGLRDIKIGDKVYILTGDKWLSYKVKEIKTVLPKNLEVIAPTPDETLTLFTCSGFADSKRLIVIAKRV